MSGRVIVRFGRFGKFGVQSSPSAKSADAWILRRCSRAGGATKRPSRGAASRAIAGARGLPKTIDRKANCRDDRRGRIVGAL